jgi:hypothetical protein
MRGIRRRLARSQTGSLDRGFEGDAEEDPGEPPRSARSGDLAGFGGAAGLATSAAIAGKSERAIMNQTGHRSVAMVRRYIRDGNLFRDNAAEGLGL